MELASSLGLLLLWLAQEAPSANAASRSASTTEIRTILQLADAERRANRYPGARELVASAWSAAKDLHGAADVNVRVLWAEIELAADRAGDDRLASRAWQACLEAAAQGEAEDLRPLYGKLIAAQQAARAGDSRRVCDLHREAWTLAQEVRDAEQRPDVATLRWVIGRAALDVRDVVTAREAYRWRREHEENADVLNGLGTVHLISEQAESARVLFESALVLLQQSPDADQVAIGKTQTDIGSTWLLSGRLAEARTRLEEAYTRLHPILPAGHHSLANTRMNLATALAMQADYRGALPLHEQAYEALRASAPRDDRSVVFALANVAVTRGKLGDWLGALHIHRQVVAVLERSATDPATDLVLARARGNLARALREIGDPEGALPLQLQVVAAFEHQGLGSLDCVRSWMNLAAMKDDLGDIDGALALHQQVVDAWSQQLDERDLLLHQAWSNLAATELRAGKVEEAHRLMVKALEARQQVLPPDSLDLLTPKLNLARVLLERGDAQGALELEEDVCRSWTRLGIDDQMDAVAARARLLSRRLQLGPPAEVPGLVRSLCRGLRKAGTAFELSPRELGARSEHSWTKAAVSTCLAAVLGCGGQEAMPDLAPDVLLMVEALRGAEVRPIRLARRARAARTEAEIEGLESEIRATAAEVARKAAAPDGGDAYASNLAAAVRAREDAMRRLLDRARQLGETDIRAATARDLGARLPAGSVGVSLVRTQRIVHPDRPRANAEDWLAALLLHPDGHVEARLLAPVHEIEHLAQQAEHAFQLLPTVVNAGTKELQMSLVALRHAVVDPLRAAAKAQTLLLATDPALALLPLDALPEDEDGVVGDRLRVRDVVSLLDLLEQDPKPVSGEPRLLAFGGLDYAAPPAGAGGGVDHLALVGRGLDGQFPPLLRSGLEARAVASLFAQGFGTGESQVVADQQGNKAALQQGAPGARFIHLATHAYFTAPSARRAASRPVDEHRFRLNDAQGPSGLSPLVLAGIALAGANRGPDELGRQAGLITGEELLALDLTAAELVVLSACDGAQGVRRTGFGLASLRSALLGAGARAVLTSLWPVADAATQELMEEFYRHLWIDHMDAHQALRQSQLAIRKREGSHLRDWAGWVLVGR